MPDKISWFTRSPGDPIAVSNEDKTMALVNAGPAIPDVVRLPPELGRDELRVLDWHEGPCFKCGQEGAIKLTLENRYNVDECRVCGFVWSRTKETQEESCPT